MIYILLVTVSEQENLSFMKLRNRRENFQIENLLFAAKEICFARKSLPSRGGSSKRAAALPEKCKAKDSIKRLNLPKFGFNYKNFRI